MLLHTAFDGYMSRLGKSVTHLVSEILGLSELDGSV